MMLSPIISSFFERRSAESYRFFESSDWYTSPNMDSSCIFSAPIEVLDPSSL